MISLKYEWPALYVKWKPQICHYVAPGGQSILKMLVFFGCSTYFLVDCEVMMKGAQGWERAE